MYVLTHLGVVATGDAWADDNSTKIIATSREEQERIHSDDPSSAKNSRRQPKSWVG